MVQNMLLSTFVLLKSLFTISNVLNPSFWLFLFIAICISAHIALSKPDIKGSIDGVIVMFIVLFLFNIIAGLFQYDSNQLIGKVMKYNMYLIAFSSVALLFSCISTLVSFGFYKIRGGRSFERPLLLSYSSYNHNAQPAHEHVPLHRYTMTGIGRQERYRPILLPFQSE